MEIRPTMTVITPDGRRGEVTRVFRTAGAQLANVSVKGRGITSYCVEDLKRAPDDPVDEGLFEGA